MKKSELTLFELLSKVIAENDLSVNTAFLTAKERSLIFERHLRDPSFLSGWFGQVQTYYDPREI